jgi:hypothetical protein
MNARWSALVIATALLLPHFLFGQGFAPAGAPVKEAEEPPTILKEFPKEIVHEGTRLYDFEFDPKPGAVVPAGSRIAMKFKYQTDAPGKIFVGAMPMAKDKHVGGYQPFALAEKEGAGEVGVMCGGYGYGATAAPAITTLEELKASYTQADTLEIIVYGQVEKQAKIRAPQSYLIIPPAPFTVKDKFYLDRLILEVISLRKRVQELEAAAR